jgi:molecular chaperone DnaK (HSP70)
MVKEAAEFAESDKKRKEQTIFKNEAQFLLDESNELTTKAKENSQVDKSIISEIESLSTKLNQQLSNENIEELLTLKKLLEDKVNELRSLLAKTNS